MKIVFIGAGNLATHLAFALQQSGRCVAQVYSRTAVAASSLGVLLQVPYTNNPDELLPDADLYCYAVSDDALETLAGLPLAPHAIHVHTAGSVSQDIFHGKKERYGVFYPLQTFSKTRPVDFKSVPVFVEASSPEVETVLFELAHAVSEQVYRINSEQRMKLHLAAVFACNFVNHLYQVASDLALSANLPFEVLKPLIRETAEKIMLLSPEEAQTGPAKRKDRTVIDKHLKVLKEEPVLEQCYRLFSDMILKQYFH